MDLTHIGPQPMGEGGFAAWIDMVRLISVCLPAREVVWWACLAGRDLVGPDGDSLCLKSAEAWVF
ncbi:MAG: hypothetical protein AAFV77_11775, partial [Planctomycetota bacterium]